MKEVGSKHDKLIGLVYKEVKDIRVIAPTRELAIQITEEAIISR